jgi:choline-sulfatase
LPLEFPHPPFTAPEPYYSMYSPKAVPAPRPYDLPGKPARLRLLREYHDLHRTPDAMLRQITAVYLGMVSYTDWLLGRVLDTLDALGLSDNTVVVAMSDHGEYGGDYGLVCKTGSSHEDILNRVPFIWRGPGISTGHRVTTPVELFDLMPTSMELADLPVSHPHFARSLLPQLRGAAGDTERAAFCEGGHGAANANLFGPDTLEGRILADTDNMYYPPIACAHDHPEVDARTVTIQTVGHKLVYRPLDESELYDLRADPEELDNRYHDPACAAIRQALEKRILDWLIETGDVTPNITHPRQGPPSTWL